MSVVTNRAWRPADDDVLVVEEGLRLVLDQERTVVTLVAGRVDLERLVLEVVHLVFLRQDRRETGAVRPLGCSAGPSPRLVIVAVTAVDDGRGRIAGLEADHAGIRAGRGHGVVGGIARAQLQ